MKKEWNKNEQGTWNRWGCTHTHTHTHTHTSSSISVVADSSVCLSKIVYKIENAIIAFINIGELKQFNKIFMFC